MHLSLRKAQFAQLQTLNKAPVSWSNRNSQIPFSRLKIKGFILNVCGIDYVMHFIGIWISILTVAADLHIWKYYVFQFWLCFLNIQKSFEMKTFSVSPCQS